ncbi:MAG TPA: ABC transporter ATP-binding protein [Gaiellales bacterium]
MEAGAVRLRALRKTFGDLVAVQSLDLDIPEGGFFSLIGPSGCGKTTTLRMVAGLEHPDSGTIEVGGEDITRRPSYRRPVNTVFQSYALFPHLDVADNVAFGLIEERRPKAEIRERVAEMLALVQLTGRERSKPSQLSGGQQQRVALARALVKHPKVLLLDEPLGALDLKLRKELQGQLKTVQRRVGITFMYVTHDQEEAFSMSDRVAVMHEGRLEQVGTPEQVYREPATLFTADFVGASNRTEGVVEQALGQGRYTLQSRSGHQVRAHGPEGLATGAAVTLIVRPESLRLGDEGWRAAITDVSYVGPAKHLELETEELGRLRATVGGGEPAAVGDRVNVSWPAEAAWIVAER